jgi:hypothetical protein
MERMQEEEDSQGEKPAKGSESEQDKQRQTESANGKL